MHEEFIEVTEAAVEMLIEKLNDPVIAVGTTSLRTLETLYWLGLKVSQDKNILAEDLILDQWLSLSSDGRPFQYPKHWIFY